LGRASEIETFVMNGESEGQIQIELEDTEGNANPIITRTLRREGNKKQRSIFTWDGNMVSGKTVRQTCLDRYKITVDNLCTFLPQDRVGSFSGFDSKQLLLETEKSLSANQHLYTTHLNLIKEQQDLSGGDDQVETLTERIQQLAAETKRFKREKERMEERQAAKDQSDLLKKKLLWLEFDNKRNATFELKDAKAEKKKLAVAAMNNAAPAEQKHEELEKKLANQEQIFKALDSEVKMHQATMKKQHGKYETFDDGIEQILLDLNGLDTQRKMQEQKVEKARQKVEELEHQLSQFNSIENLDEEIAQVTEERKQIHPMFQSAKKELQKLEEKSRQIQDERKRLEGKWRKLQDEKAQRRANIFRQQPVLKKIVDWLSQNRNKFRKEVVGPICCEIATKSKNAAAYVEMQCANSTLKAFVVQTKEDYDLLYNTVRRKLKLPINVIFVPRVETRRREYSDEKINILKRDHGIIGYLDQSFTAPQVVMQALTNYHNVDKVLVGSEQTQNSIDSRGLSKYLSEAECGSGRARNFSIFTPQGEKSFQYTANVSKYSKKVNLRIDDVRPAKW
jgi:chromosome segregation ATPase